MSQTDFKDALIDTLPSLRAFAKTFQRDPSRAEDLVQEAIVKAWTKREQFTMGTNMRAWLFMILRNTHYSAVRKARREVEDVDGSLTESLVSQPSQDSHMEFQDFRSALASLNDDQREALILVGASGFSYEEAAEICGVAPGTIKSRVSRARQTLTEVLGYGATRDGATDPTLIAASGSGADRAAQAF